MIEERGIAASCRPPSTGRRTSSAFAALALGPQCTSPYECAFMARCWPALPAHHVSTLSQAAVRSDNLVRILHEWTSHPRGALPPEEKERIVSVPSARRG